MNGIQSDLFKNFNAPQAESLFSFHFLTHLATNIFSLGIYGCCETINQQFRFCILEREKEYLLNKISNLDNDWTNLEMNLTNLMQEFNTLRAENGIAQEENQELDALKRKFTNLKTTKGALVLRQQVLINQEIEAPLIGGGSKKVVLGIMTFIANWIFTLSTLGFYSTYQSHILRDRIKILEAENQHLKDLVQPRMTRHNNSWKEHIDTFSKTLEDRQELIAIRVTDAAVLRLQLQRLSDASAHTQNNLNLEIQRLQTQLTVLRQDKQTLENKITRLEDAARVSRQMEQTFNAIIQEMHVEHERLQLQINRLNANQRDVPRVRGNGVVIDPLANLRTKLQEPIRSKYALTDENQLQEVIFEIKGAEGVQDADDIPYESWSAYAKRYNKLETSFDIVRTGFDYALEEIFKLARDENSMIRLNESVGTPKHAGAVIYRFLALDLLKGGYLFCDCNGHPALILNNKGVKMVCAEPKWIWDGNDKLVQSLCFTHRDDFTPEEEDLGPTPARYGPDPITAAILLAKFSEEEKNHLFSLLMEPVIDDDNLKYQAELQKIKEMSEEKQNQMYELCDLIIKMGIVLEIKFDKLVTPQWQPYLDTENLQLEPLRKKRVEVEEVEVVEDEALEPYELIPWEFNFNILADVKDGVARQADFALLMMEVKKIHQAYFRNLNYQLLKNPMGTNVEIDSVVWDQITNQYYKCHDYIQSEGCLFSSLLSVLMIDQEQINQRNILHLKNAMAAYLDNQENAAIFEGALRNDYNCSVDEYKQWLRGEASVPNIKTGQLTPAQIEILAYTLGVRFALFSPTGNSYSFTQTKCLVDKYGRLVPDEVIEGHYFGPPTQEVFFIAVNNGFTYYSLFPKLELNEQKQRELDISETDFASIKKLHGYWEKKRVVS